ncbi:MAG: hypothetical protein ACP6IS_11190 [Candidatus Asgardarchaeia archaeon]
MVTVLLELRKIISETISRGVSSYGDILSGALYKIITGDKFDDIVRMLSSVEWDLREAVTAILVSYGEGEVRKKALNIIKHYDEKGLIIRSDPIPFVTALYHMVIELRDYEPAEPLFKILYRTWRNEFRSEAFDYTKEILRAILATVSRTFRKDYVSMYRDLFIITDDRKLQHFSREEQALYIIVRLVSLLDLKNLGIKLNNEEKAIISKRSPEFALLEKLSNLLAQSHIVYEYEDEFIIENDYQFSSVMNLPRFSLIQLYFLNRFIEKWNKKFRLMYEEHIQKYFLYKTLYSITKYILPPLIIPIVSFFFRQIVIDYITIGGSFLTFLVLYFFSKSFAKLDRYLSWIPDKLFKEKIRAYSYKLEENVDK